MSMLISVVCTGERSHRRIEMRRFAFNPTPLPLRGYRGWRELRNHMAAPLEDSYVFRCRRNTEMKAATLRRALDGLSAAGRAQAATWADHRRFWHRDP